MFYCSCPYLAQNVSILIPIVGGILFLFTMSALLRTSLTDPGIIPRATQDEAAYVEKQIGKYFILITYREIMFYYYFRSNKFCK